MELQNAKLFLGMKAVWTEKKSYMQALFLDSLDTEDIWSINSSLDFNLKHKILSRCYNLIMYLQQMLFSYL